MEILSPHTQSNYLNTMILSTCGNYWQSLSHNQKYYCPQKQKSHCRSQRRKELKGRSQAIFNKQLTTCQKGKFKIIHFLFQKMRHFSIMVIKQCIIHLLNNRALLHLKCGLIILKALINLLRTLQ